MAPPPSSARIRSHCAIASDVSPGFFVAASAMERGPLHTISIGVAVYRFSPSHSSRLSRSPKCTVSRQR